MQAVVAMVSMNSSTSSKIDFAGKHHGNPRGGARTYLLDVWVQLLVWIDLLYQFLELALAEQTHAPFIKLKRRLLDDGRRSKDLVPGRVGTAA